MKSIFLLFLLLSVTVYLGCEKTNYNSNKETAAAVNNSITLDDTVRIPITDLGTGTYMGFTGGLYPGGANTPAVGSRYEKALVDFVHSIAPRSPKGKLDSGTNAKIGFISLGISTSGDIFIALKQKTKSNPLCNPWLRLVNCSNGGGDAFVYEMIDSTSAYWRHVDTILRTSFVTHKQVQIAYIETEDTTAMLGFPARPNRYRDDFEAALRVCKNKFPNLKLVYVLGRTTTFGKLNILNTEPTPYYNGWTMKFVIEDQINRVPGVEYKGSGTVAPLVTWGWYDWADGSTTPRQDGFIWRKYLTDDGIHPNDAGKDTLSRRWQNFFFADPYANVWYANHATP